MPWIRPLSKSLTGPLSVAAVLAWLGCMTALVEQSYFRAPVILAADVSKYDRSAQWRGIYYRGAKVGYSVSQTTPRADGFELLEEGQLEMTLLGATSAALIRTSARVDRDFALQSFDFSLDPGTGAVQVRGTVDGNHLSLVVRTRAGERTDEIVLDAPPALTLNLGRRLAAGGLETGVRHVWSMFDPATLRNSPLTITVGDREVVRTGDQRIPAFRVELATAGLQTTSWITDTGEIVREESPLGFLAVREPADVATAMAVSGRVQQDLLDASAIVPTMSGQIDDPRDVRRIRLRLDGAPLPRGELDGVGQRADGNVIEVVDPRTLGPDDATPWPTAFLSPEPFIESDAPEIQSEAQRAIQGATDTRTAAEQLVRYVNGLLEKKPTVSLPSAREVLRTRIGDCNEHTVLYVAMARAAGIPARISVGLAYTRGAFYYHAWPEVYVEEAPSRGYWLPVDPTLNQFPADATHVRLARGGLDQQVVILPLVGQLEMTVLELDVTPGSERITVGAPRPSGPPETGP